MFLMEKPSAPGVPQCGGSGVWGRTISAKMHRECASAGNSNAVCSANKASRAIDTADSSSLHMDTAQVPHN